MNKVVKIVDGVKDQTPGVGCKSGWRVLILDVGLANARGIELI